ncbi:unnamed protein product [Cylicocyclus nassatus]|uniref:Uncharacterized protein n=1 Tax=Cylicocyclus nassatus TaxID=53992 RepID=A0AA36DSA8_CYLNA|nr:unnamed protein product [Cylicocyclus nassatus]
MFLSSKANVAARIPMIKFIGARLPRPNFAKVASGPIPSAPTAAAAPAKPSAGSIGRTPRGSGIPEENLPPYYRRPPISQEECDAINAGGSYGLILVQYNIVMLMYRCLDMTNKSSDLEIFSLLSRDVYP